MTIWGISEKVGYIAERHRRLQDQWRIYYNSLVQGIILPKARLHHMTSCVSDKGLCFVLFKHFTIYVMLTDGFNGHTIEYYVETKDGDDKQLTAQAELTIDDRIDERISNRDREQALDHYLEEIATVYDSLYTVVENNTPVNLSQLVEGHSPVRASGAAHFAMVRSTYRITTFWGIGMSRNVEMTFGRHVFVRSGYHLRNAW